jgi:hypothetical protein
LPSARDSQISCRPISSESAKIAAIRGAKNFAVAEIVRHVRQPLVDERKKRHAIGEIAFGTRIAIHRVMSPDVFETERCRVDHVLQLLDDAAVRLRSRSHVPLVLLNDAVEFLTASEDAALDDAQADDDRPPLLACLEQHWAARLRLTAMQEALLSLNLGDASAASRFADVAREYVQLRREHMRLDDQLFASALKAFPKSMAAAVPSDAYESVTTRRLYHRLVETSAILGIGVATAYPAERRRFRTR